MTTKIFFDMEFTGLHQNTTPISIGCISEMGETFYAEFDDFDQRQCDEWIEENVLRKLILPKGAANVIQYYDPYSRNVFFSGTKKEVAQELLRWLSAYSKIQFVGDVLGYDWVLLCQILGNGALGLPSNIYYAPIDICSFIDRDGSDPSRLNLAFGESVGLDRLAYKYMGQTKYFDKESGHNALYDAYVIKAICNRLNFLQ